MGLPMRIGLLFMFFVSVAILPVVNAQFVDISVEPAHAFVHSDRTAEFTITIENLKDIEDVFIISAAGKRIEWRSQGHLLMRLQPFAKETFTEDFFAFNAEPGVYDFEYRVKSFNYPDVSDSAPFKIEVLQPFSLKGMTAVREGEGVSITLEANSRSVEDVQVLYEVFGPDGSVMVSETHEEPVLDDTTVQRFISISRYAPPGEYVVRATARGEVMEAGFSVPEIRGLEKTEERIPTTFYEDVVISVTNTGNVEDTYSTQQVSSTGDALTGHVTAPNNCFESGTERRCSYELLVPPGQTREIRYRIEYWPTFTKFGAGIMAVAILGIFTAVRYTKPKIRKKYRKGRRHMSIVLNVRNRFGRTGGVVVRDWVSPLASVVMEEFEAVRPVVRRSDAGTELIWNLGDMKSGEERFVSYKIKPHVHGSLKMPPATLRYKKGSGNITRVRSNPVVIQ